MSSSREEVRGEQEDSVSQHGSFAARQTSESNLHLVCPLLLGLYKISVLSRCAACLECASAAGQFSNDEHLYIRVGQLQLIQPVCSYTDCLNCPVDHVRPAMRSDCLQLMSVQLC